MTVRIFHRPSPNHGARPAGTTIDCIVLHADAARTVAQSLGWILQAKSGVSYHYLIGRLGDVYECVPPERRAWHAGRSAFEGRPDCNDYAIGVSFGNLNDGVEPYRDDQLGVFSPEELARLGSARRYALEPAPGELLAVVTPRERSTAAGPRHFGRRIEFILGTTDDGLRILRMFEDFRLP